jgi:uncharacterized protein (DUF2062 family)
MYKNFLHKLPKKEDITKHHASWLGAKIHDHNLWEFNVQSVSRGIAIGLLFAFIPLPIQMALAIIFSALFSANVPLAIACTWITNPITFIPINYFIVRVGNYILNVENHELTIKNLDLNNDWSKNFEALSNLVHTLGKPFLVGLPITAISVSIISYILVITIWFTVLKAKNFIGN